MSRPGCLVVVEVVGIEMYMRLSVCLSAIDQEEVNQL